MLIPGLGTAGSRTVPELVEMVNKVATTMYVLRTIAYLVVDHNS